MTTEGTARGRRGAARPRGLDIVLSVLVAFNFAVAQPILDLTGRFPQFFLARRAPRVDLFLLAFGLAIVIPGAAALTIWLLRRASRRAGTALHILVVGGLASVLATQLLDRIPGAREAAAPILAVGAAAVGVTTIVAYYRSSGFRSFVRIAAVAALVLPATFLLTSPASKLVLRRSAAISGSSIIANPVPVVVLLLDELPVASLMDRDGGIDAGMFPGFARLAAGSTWFRNATAVHDFTEIAVPSILTGSYGDKRKLPIPEHYPDNLFTLLDGAYEIHAFESFTQLCPPAMCASSAEPAPAFWPRWRAMLKDLGIVYEHVVAPRSLEDRLPSIDQTWSNFSRTDGRPASGAVDAPSKVTLAEDPLGDLRRFTASVEPTRDLTLWFAHIELPHAPWRYLPSGQEYPQRSPIPGKDGQVWQPDDWLTAQAYQRHLLQTAMVDGQLDALIDRLREAGVWDRALVVVTADHGISFRPGSDLRVAADETVGEIAAVPMFVKLPGQRTGEVDDRPVETLDVVPTILDVLDVEGAPRMDGVSVFDSTHVRTEKVMRSMRGHRVVFGIDGTEKDAVVERKLDLFGSSGGLERLYAITPGPYGGLLGDAVTEGGRAAAGRVTIDSAGSYHRFDPAADVVRSLVTGTVSGGPPSSAILAVAVEGRVVAVTRAFVRAGQIRFHAMVPLDAFTRGSNDLDVYLVEGSPSPSLHLIPQAV